MIRISYHDRIDSESNFIDNKESRKKMGVLWEVVQTGLMYGQKRKSDTIEDRVQALEDQLQLTQNTLRNLVRKIEEIHGLDIDGDGKVG
jgi:uncharacterized Rmd1/YagE family protein